jgi:secondary thiamine-phosphate synthase enzyme
MQQASETFEIDTGGKGLTEFSGRMRDFVAASGIETGLLTAFCRHTSASLLITENAAGAVKRDLLKWLERAAPEAPDYEHDCEGPDDMPAHLKQVLTGTTLTIPVAGGAPLLGTWQGVFLAEHRAAPHRREIALHLIGE